MNCGRGESAQRRGQIGYCIHSVCVFAHVDMCPCTYAGKHTWSDSGLNVLSIMYLQSECQILFLNLLLPVIVTQILLVPMHVTVFATASYIKGDT